MTRRKRCKVEGCKRPRYSSFQPTCGEPECRAAWAPGWKA